MLPYAEPLIFATGLFATRHSRMFPFIDMHICAFGPSAFFYWQGTFETLPQHCIHDSSPSIFAHTCSSTSSQDSRLMEFFRLF